MRKGRQYFIFSVSPRPGLSNYLSGVGTKENDEAPEELSNYLQETEIENLYLMAAGNIPPNPSELLISEQMVELLEKLKETFDIVIIDGTPSQLVTDSLILTRLVDSTIVVTASNKTKKEDLKGVINNIQNVGGKISGVVLNKVQITAKKYNETYYYGSTRTAAARGPRKANSNEMYNRASSIIETNNSNKKPTSKTQTTRKTNNKAKEVQKAIKDTNNDNKEKVSVERTQDILNQINQYLEDEKKKTK
mgnify:FL=1